MAEPIRFKGSNAVIGAGDNPGVLDLPAFFNGSRLVSCWRLTPEELEEVQRTGCVFLSVLYHSMPPVLVGSGTVVNDEAAQAGGGFVEVPVDPRLAPDAMGWLCDLCGRKWGHGEDSGCERCKGAL